MAIVHATLDDVRALMAHATGDEKHEESTTSAMDALWVLYDRILRIDPAAPEAEDRDRLIVSKGHGPAALYAILAAKGFFPAEWLDRFLEHDGHLGGHPDRTQVPGIEASTGSSGTGSRWRWGSRSRCAPRGPRSSGRSCCAATPSSTRARTGRRSCSRRSSGSAT